MIGLLLYALAIALSYWWFYHQSKCGPYRRQAAGYVVTLVIFVGGALTVYGLFAP